MHTLQIISENTNWQEILQNDFAISAKNDPLVPDYFNLCYDQIGSPKSHKLVQECRGVVVDASEPIAVGRPFDRFYNYGEVPDITKSINFENCTVFDKLDGSIITFYFSEKYNTWLVSTKSTTTARSSFTKNRIAFLHLILEALNCNSEHFSKMSPYIPEETLFIDDSVFWTYMDMINNIIDPHFDRSYTYICELTSPHNQIVTKYDESELTLIGCRHIDGYYRDINEMSGTLLNVPKTYQVNGLDEIQKVLDDLNNGKENVLEGFVVMDNETHVRTKIKSGTYLKIHRALGGKFTRKDAIRVAMDGEEDEFLSYYPEHKDAVMDLVKKREEIIEKIDECMEFYDNNISDRKTVAQELRKFNLTGVVFPAKSKGISNPRIAFSSVSSKLRYDLIDKW